MFRKKIHMFTLQYPVEREMQWRVVLILTLLYLLGNLAGIPLLLKTGVPIEPIWFWGVATLVSTVIIILSQAMATRTALGAPLLEGKLPRSKRISWIRSGLGLTILILIFSLPFSLYANRLVDPTTYPFGWELLAASLKAGLVEEIGYRFFMITLLVWIGRFLAHDQEGRPRQAVYWFAIILAGLIFGWAHVDYRLGHPSATLWDYTVIMVLNSTLGITFGWLFWRLGLEWAIIAHFVFDGFASFFLIPIYLSSNPLAWVGLAAGVIFTVLISWRMLTINSASDKPE